ncbi:phospholipase D-like domain-containing protein [Acidihalobacter ferrooxydans]|uniref:phospholipase D n=1 Tax=Acidihalobacter ferrooxydans TaxID=1765967 RepID=A0A1P8UEM6_9GAMM|nr:phospholipase D-like domain-containing protein [Acidihalobacter ferrooxydans]APZ42297.1 hypothetical protein BW247_03670 [Acidihalobacter ferrooxydans]
MIYVEPHAGVQPVVHLIQAAHQSVFINAYLIDDRRILAAIHADTQRGVVVQVLLESRPYHVHASWVQHEFQMLINAGAEVRWAPSRFAHRYAYDHAKYIVDDAGKGRALIGTANFTYSAFHRNREYLWTTTNTTITHALAGVFEADWTRQHVGAGPRAARSLVISPGGERALLKVLQQPGPVAMESEELGDVPRISAALERKGKQVRIIVPTNLSRYDRGNLRPLQRAGVGVRYLGSPHPHAKMIVGDTLGFIGSQNISWVSLHHNREIGIILRGRALSVLRRQFNRDWSKATPTP